MTEKRNVIEPERTPAAESGTKTAAELEDHITKRAEDAVVEAIKEQTQTR